MKRKSSFVCCKYTTKVKTFEWMTRDRPHGIVVVVKQAGLGSERSKQASPSQNSRFRQPPVPSGMAMLIQKYKEIFVQSFNENTNSF